MPSQGGQCSSPQCLDSIARSRAFGLLFQEEYTPSSLTPAEPVDGILSDSRSGLCYLSRRIALQTRFGWRTEVIGWPSETRWISSLCDLCTPWCVYTVATLRIANQLEAGITRIDELASASGSDSESLHRVLRYLVDKGIFEEPATGEFALNEAARGLLDSALLLGLDLNGIGGRMAYAWGTMLSAVRTGAPAYQEVFGRPFWEDLQAHPVVAASFDDLMGPAGHGIPDAEVLISGDWESVRTVVDVGGGTGTQLAEILRARPTVRGTLIDLPRTVVRSSEVFQSAGVVERATAIGQSFFDPLPAGADLYLLKKDPRRLARSRGDGHSPACAEAAFPTGRVIVLGGVSAEETEVPSPELLMMVLVGGKSRNLAEFRELARAAGLEVQAFGRSPSGRFVVECGPTG